MGELIAVGVVAGFLAAISPCILPVLPVILVTGARPGDLEQGRARRPVLVVLGLVRSFSLLVLAGSELLSLLHLPQDTLRDVGLALLALVGLGYLIPPLGTLLERPFARLGARRLQYLDPADSVRDAAASYHFPATLPLGAVAWSGAWTDHAQEATAGDRARLELSFLAYNVYLVLGGHGRIGVAVNGRPVKTIEVSGVPRLYTLYQADFAQPRKLLLTVSPGVQAYDFTFG